MPDPWIPFAERWPKQPHGLLLVTTDPESRNLGKADRVWLTWYVYDPSPGGGTDICAWLGDRQITGLTHWRPALPEERAGEEGQE